MKGSTTGHKVDIDLDRLGAIVTATKENVSMTLLRASCLGSVISCEQKQTQQSVKCGCSK